MRKPAKLAWLMIKNVHKEALNPLAAIS